MNSERDQRAPRWMRTTLWLAAAYNLLWGGAVIAAPNLLFTTLGMAAPTYPQIWQCVGMIVGVYGIGYAIAAGNPLRHWPIVLVGLLGKVFGPIGFLGAAMNGDLPWAFGATIITNDLIWWIPFTLILLRARERHLSSIDAAVEREGRAMTDAMREAVDQNGVTLLEHSAARKTLVVFLRHAGCTFCREALADIQERRSRIESNGAQIVLVHMGPEDEKTRAFLKKYGVDDLPRFSDPERSLYRAFGLHNGDALQLFGPTVWFRGVSAFFRGHFIGMLAGDGFQMPGVFLVRDGRILDAHRHRTAADRPDYLSMSCEAPA